MMNRRTLLIASILAGSGLTFAVQAAPPEGKGQGNGKGNSSKGGGNGKGNGNGNSGNAGNNGNSGQPGNSGAHGGGKPSQAQGRSEEPTSELQSLMRISYAVFCLKKKNKTTYRLHGQ